MLSVRMPCLLLGSSTASRLHGRKMRGVHPRVSLCAPLVKIGLQQSVTTTSQENTTWTGGTARYEPDPPRRCCRHARPATACAGGGRVRGGRLLPVPPLHGRTDRTALLLQHTHRSTNPSKEPPGRAQRSTTESTRPGVFPPLRCPRSRSQSGRGPSATTSTRPSSRFVAAPVRPSSNPRARVHQRKPTPWTLPRTHAVSRTGSVSCPTTQHSPLPHGDTFLTNTPGALSKPSRPRTRSAQERARGARWQPGQLNDERFMNASRTIAVPQRPQGRSRRP